MDMIECFFYIVNGLKVDILWCGAYSCPVKSNVHLTKKSLVTEKRMKFIQDQ